MEHDEHDRKFRRVEVNLPAHYGEPDLLSDPSNAAVINMGADGLCLATKKPVKLDEEFFLKIELSGHESITIKVKVVWSVAQQDQGKNLAGIKVMEGVTGDEVKFSRLYCEKILFYPKSRAKILVVDDEEDIARVLTLQLEANGYEVFCAYDGESAFEKYLKERPVLIILDLMLPKLNGYEVCRRIRCERRDKNTAILMLSAKTDDVDRIVGRVIGAERYMTKPYEIKDILFEVKTLIELSVVKQF